MPNQMSVGRTPADRLMSTARWDEPAVRFNTVSLSPADVLHIPGLRFDGLVGYSPSRWPRMPSGWPKTPSSTGRPSSPTALPPGGVLEHPGTIKDPARVREYWQSTFGGAATPQGRRPRRRHALHPHLVGLSPEQAQFLQTRKFQINEIARVFRIPPHMIGDPDKSSPSNIEQQSLEFVKYTLGPWGVRWEQAITKTLFASQEKPRFFVGFNLEDLLRGDYASRMNGYAVARQNGWMSANDIRALENFNRVPREGSDLYLINGNMLPLAHAGAFAPTQGEPT